MNYFFQLTQVDVCVCVHEHVFLQVITVKENFLFYLQFYEAIFIQSKGEKMKNHEYDFKYVICKEIYRYFKF